MNPRLSTDHIDCPIRQLLLSKTAIFVVLISVLPLVLSSSSSTSSSSSSSLSASTSPFSYSFRSNSPRKYQANLDDIKRKMSGNRHTTYPMITGTSVVGLTYDGGILLAADTLLSFGKMAKSFDSSRMKKLEHADNIVMAASGEYSDFQEVVRMVEALCLEWKHTDSMASIYESEQSSLTAASLSKYLRTVMYQRRSKFDPFWNDLVVAGVDSQPDGTSKPFLGVVDKLGTTRQDDLIATGFGAYLALPLLREKWRPDLSEGEARALLEDCMKVLFYRDCRASPRIQLAKVTTGDGDEAPTCLVSEPYEIEHGAGAGGPSEGWNAPSMARAVGDLGGAGGW